MTEQHTPGPWVANLHHTQKVGGRTYGFIMADGIVPVAAVVLGVEGVPQDEGRANARVLAAAPDMLRALIVAQAALKSYQYGNTATDLAAEIGAYCDAAIAKAAPPALASAE